VTKPPLGPLLKVSQWHSWHRTVTEQHWDTTAGTDSVWDDAGRSTVNQLKWCCQAGCYEKLGGGDWEGLTADSRQWHD